MWPRQLLSLFLLGLPLADDVGPGLIAAAASATALLLGDGVVRRRLRGRNVDLAGREGANDVAKCHAGLGGFSSRM